MGSTSDIERPVAAITGASRGIGAAAARALAAAGYRLALTAQHEESLTALDAEWGGKSLIHAGDVADTAATQAFYHAIHARYGRLDVLVANAGILMDGLIGMISPAGFARACEVNVAGVLNHLQLAARLMRRRRAGSIVVVSSIFGVRGAPGQTAYAATKAALLGMAFSAAKELGPDGIRVNAIAPGMIETDMTKDLPPSVREERLRGIPLGRMGTPDEVADVISFLASDKARYVTGQTIGIDGGMVI